MIKLLTNSQVLRDRFANAEKMMEEEQKTGPASGRGMDHAYQSLQTLLTYLKNAIGGDSRPIPRKNARYMSTLSDECSEIFYQAHFTEDVCGSMVYAGVAADRRQMLPETGLVWVPPSTEAVRDRTSAVRTDLVEMYEEVNILRDRHKGDKRNDMHSLFLRFS